MYSLVEVEVCVVGRRVDEVLLERRALRSARKREHPASSASPTKSPAYLVVDARVRSKTDDVVALVLATSDADDALATDDVLGELDRGASRRSRSARNDDRVLRLDVSDLVESVPRGEASAAEDAERERGAREALGDSLDSALTEHGELGPAHVARDKISDLPLGRGAGDDAAERAGPHDVACREMSVSPHARWPNGGEAGAYLRGQGARRDEPRRRRAGSSLAERGRSTGRAAGAGPRLPGWATGLEKDFPGKYTSSKRIWTRLTRLGRELEGVGRDGVLGRIREQPDAGRGGGAHFDVTGKSL